MKVVISDTSRQWANNLNDLRERHKIHRENANETEWMPVRLFAEEIKGLDRHALLALKTETIEIVQQIGKRLYVAKAKVAIGGKYSDPGWFAEVTAAHKSVANHVQAIDAALAVVKRPKPFPSYFMDAAHEMLPPDQFNQIFERGRQLQIERDGPKPTSKNDDQRKDEEP